MFAKGLRKGLPKTDHRARLCNIAPSRTRTQLGIDISGAQRRIAFRRLYSLPKEA